MIVIVINIGINTLIIFIIFLIHYDYHRLHDIIIVSHYYYLIMTIIIKTIVIIINIITTTTIIIVSIAVIPKIIIRGWTKYR